MLKFDREKYLRILKTDGPNAALTLLHAEMGEWEKDTFEGEKGYQPEMWKDLAEARQLSRELWELATK